MKKTYEAPTVEVVEFKYRDQVVAASGINTHKCEIIYSHGNNVEKCKEVESPIYN